MKHLINWLEIPAESMERAKEFYSVIFRGIEFSDMEINGNEYALFPAEDSFNAGALVCGTHYRPSGDGIVVYLDGGDDMNLILEQVERAGGEILMNKSYMGEDAGYIGMFIDSEGNKIGLQHQ